MSIYPIIETVAEANKLEFPNNNIRTSKLDLFLLNCT